jgi:hypothetical protein
MSLRALILSLAAWAGCLCAAQTPNSQIVRSYPLQIANWQTVGMASFQDSGVVVFGKVGTDFVVLRFDRFGNEIAQARFNSPYGPQQSGGNIVVNQTTGDIWIGYQLASSVGQDIMVHKFSPLLVQTASRRIDTGEFDSLGRIDIGPSGGLFIASYRSADSGFSAYNVQTTLLSASGSVVYSTEHDWSTTGRNSIHDVKFEPVNNVIWVGTSDGLRARLIRLSSTGSSISATLMPADQDDDRNEIISLEASTAGTLFIFGNGRSQGVRKGFRAYVPNANVNNLSSTYSTARLIGADIKGMVTADVSFDTSYGLRRASQFLYFAPLPSNSFDPILSRDQSAIAVRANVPAVNGLKVTATVWNNSLTQTGEIKIADGEFGANLVPVGNSEFALGYSKPNGSLNYVQFNGAAQVAFHNSMTFPGYGYIELEDTAADAANNQYKVTQNSTSGTGIFLAKYSLQGQLLWETRLGDAGTDDAILKLGPDQNPVVLIPHTQTSILHKLDPANGLMRWQQAVAGRARALSVGGDNSIATVSHEPWFYNTLDFSLRQFRADGSFLRVRRFDYAGQIDTVDDVEVLPTGYIVMSGVGRSNAEVGLVIVYTPTGVLHDVRTFAAPDRNYSTVKLAPQSSGLLGVGALYRKNGMYAFDIIKLDPIRKTTIFSATLNGNTDEPRFDVAVAMDGAMYLAQSNYSSKGLVQFDPSGVVRFVKSLPAGTVEVKKVITDKLNSVYALGSEKFTDSEGGLTLGAYFVKYSSSGTLLADRRLRTVGPNLHTLASNIHLGAVNDVWVGTAVTTASTGYNTVLSRYLQPVGPSVVNENYTVRRGQTLVVAAPGLLANDVDHNGDSITCIQNGSPAAGTLTLQPTGAFTYVAPLVTGSQYVRYVVRDSTGLQSPGLATISVTN